MSILSRPEFHDEEAAYAYIEARLWTDGPVCPHCGGFERISKMGESPLASASTSAISAASRSRSRSGQYLKAAT